MRCETNRPSGPIDMLLSAVSVLVVAQSSSEIPEGLLNNPVFHILRSFLIYHISKHSILQIVFKRKKHLQAEYFSCKNKLPN